MQNTTKHRTVTRYALVSGHGNSHRAVAFPSASKHPLTPARMQFLDILMAFWRISAPASALGMTLGATDCNHSPASFDRASNVADTANRDAPIPAVNAFFNFRVGFSLLALPPEKDVTTRAVEMILPQSRVLRWLLVGGCVQEIISV